MKNKLIAVIVIGVLFSGCGSTFSQGITALNNGNNLHAVKLFTKEAKQGHGESQGMLCFIYYNGGNGIKQDYKKSFKYCKLAANQNIIGGQNGLGFHYYHGHVVEKDLTKARKYFTLTAEKNDSNGNRMLRLINKNEDLRGVPKK